jgi:hypothetical protein
LEEGAGVNSITQEMNKEKKRGIKKSKTRKERFETSMGFKGVSSA